MKRLILALTLFAPILANAAWPAKPMFNTNDFIYQDQPGLLSILRTNFVGTTNIFNNTVTINTNVYVTNVATTVLYTNSTVIFTNSTVTINGTNVGTVNPTIGRLPYKDGTNSFGDSALTYIDPNTVGTDNLNTSALLVTNISGGGVLYGKTFGGTSGYVTNLANAVGVLTNDASGNVGWGTVAGGVTGVADPSASVGLSAVNGTATTAIRSDGAPALSQSIAPTWSGTHTFNQPIQFNITGGTNSLSLDASARLTFTNANTSPAFLVVNGTAKNTQIGVNPSYGFLTTTMTQLLLGTAAKNITFDQSASGILPNTAQAWNLGSPTDPFGVIFAQIYNHTPASSSETNFVGAFCYDSTYLYVWTATNVNKRLTFGTW